jgi:hypothetical protein
MNGRIEVESVVDEGSSTSDAELVRAGLRC